MKAPTMRISKASGLMYQSSDYTVRLLTTIRDTQPRQCIRNIISINATRDIAM